MTGALRMVNKSVYSKILVQSPLVDKISHANESIRSENIFDSKKRLLP